MTYVRDMVHVCRRAEQLEREAEREQRLRAEAKTVTAPATVECVTCGGEAQTTTWGRAREVAYRCTECHAGGELIVDDRGAVHRKGGVFERLENYATCRLETEVSG